MPLVSNITLAFKSVPDIHAVASLRTVTLGAEFRGVAHYTVVGCKRKILKIAVLFLMYIAVVFLSSSITSYCKILKLRRWKHEQHTSNIRCVTRNLQWGGANLGGWRQSPQRSKNVFFCKNDLILNLF